MLVHVRAYFMHESSVIFIIFMIYIIKFKYHDKYDMNTIKKLIILYYHDLLFVFSLLYNLYGI